MKKGFLLTRSMKLSNAMELAWMVEAGLSPMQALVATTASAARALGWDNWPGTLEPGKVADLVVVSGNPLENMRLLADRRTTKLVLKNRQIVAQPAASSLVYSCPVPTNWCF